MDLTKELPFKVGDEIKNYKEMCRLLGEKERGGNSRKSQLKRWQNYFSWEKKGYSFVIKEIINNDFPCHDDNLIGRNVKHYSNELQRLILNLLYQEGVKENKYKVILSLKTIVVLTKLANEASFSLRMNHSQIQKQASEIKVNPILFYETINRAHGTAYSDIKTALNQLKRKQLIEYNVTKMLCTSQKYSNGIPVEELTTLRDIFPIPIFTELYQNYGLFNYRPNHELPVDKQEEEYQNQIEEYKSSTDLIFREAEDFEIAAMLHLRQVALDSLGLASLQHAHATGKFLDYIRKLKSLSQYYLGIEYMFDGYKILFSPAVIQRQYDSNKELYKLSQREREIIERELQKGFIELYLNKLSTYKKNASKENQISFTDATEIDPFASDYIKTLLTESDSEEQISEILKFLTTFNTLES